MLVAYEKDGHVYYDYGHKIANFVDKAKLVSVSGNSILYEKNGHVYKAEVDSYGNIRNIGVFVR